MKRLLAISDLVDALKAGQVGLMPFDTTWGIGAIATPENVRRIQLIKGRDSNKPFLIMIPDPTSLDQWASPLVSWQREWVGKLWPGPVTLVFDRHPDLDDILTAPLTSIALRAPGFGPIRDLVSAVGRGLLSTSANAGNEAPQGDGSGVFDPRLEEKMDFVATPFFPEHNGASSIVDLRSEPIRLLRRGLFASEIEHKIAKH